MKFEERWPGKKACLRVAASAQAGGVVC